MRTELQGAAERKLVESTLELFESFLRTAAFRALYPKAEPTEPEGAEALQRVEAKGGAALEEVWEKSLAGLQVILERQPERVKTVVLGHIQQRRKESGV